MLSIVTTLSCSAHAVTQAPPEESRWYYEIGGAQSISVAPNINQSSTALSASANWGVNMSCGKFDPVLGVSNVLNGIKTGTDALMNNMLSAATSAIASLPALILQRANPGLYDLFQGGLLAAQEQVTLATKNCEQMEQEMAQGINPYEKWATLAVGRDWKVEMGTGGSSSSSTDVISAKQTIENNGGKNGIDWLGGTRGGQGQPPIDIPTDMVRAGYNIAMNRAPYAAGIPSGTGRIKDLWPNVEAARDFSIGLLGKEEIYTYDGHINKNTPGKGLLYFIGTEKVAVKDLLVPMVANPGTATVANLEAVTSPGTRLSKEVITALSRLKTAEKSIFIDKISEEIAMARLVEKALFVRRMITMGREQPDMAHALEAKDVSKYLDQINVQIEAVLFEKRIRQELAGDTIPVLLAMEKRRKINSLRIKRTPAYDIKEIKGGAVKP